MDWKVQTNQIKEEKGIIIAVITGNRTKVNGHEIKRKKLYIKNKMKYGRQNILKCSTFSMADITGTLALDQNT